MRSWTVVAPDTIAFAETVLVGLAVSSHSTATNVWHKVGVMIRNDLTPGSAHGMTLVSSGKGLAIQRRLTSGGVSTSTAGPLLAAPRWLRISAT